MVDPDVLSADDERLLQVAMAIADGTPVDWSAATPSGSTPPLSGDPVDTSPVIVRLQLLERLVQGHQAVRSRPTARRAAAHETLLTEARRKSDVLSEAPLRVQWGPLIVLEKVGRGSFGDVYRAWDPRLDREVALKLVPEERSASPSSPVVEEGRLLARVRHPNVMIVHGAERIEDRVGIWTEYVRGETLASEVGRRGPLAAEEAARVGVDVCAALGAVHAAGLLHRDVKAQNILRDSTGRIVLGDFGTGMEFADDAGVTEPQIAGTPLYLAPEVFEGNPATVATDVYGVGVLLYFLVTGEYPVRGCTVAEIKGAHAAGQRVPLREVRPELPDTFIDIVETLLFADPAGRCGTAAAAEAALQAWLTPPSSAAHRPLRDRLAPAAVVGAIILSAVIAGGVWRYRSPSQAAEARQGVETLVPPAPLRLNAGDWIVVAHVKNDTGEAVLDGTIEAAVRRELQYSDYVRVAQRDRVEDALLLLQRPVDSRLDATLARELSLRDGGIRAYIIGTIAKAADGYTLTFDVMNPVSRTPMATVTERASVQTEILPAVRRQTLRIREALGEPRTSIERSRQALQRAALPSLKAMKLSSQGLAMIDERPARIPVQQASPELPPPTPWVAIKRIAREMVLEDPTFAVGHLMLAYAVVRDLSTEGAASAVEDTRRQEGLLHAERALRLIDGATPQERYFVIGTLHAFKGGGSRGPGSQGPQSLEERHEYERAVSAWEALFALQPDAYFVRNALRFAYQSLGRQRDVAWMNLHVAEARPRSVQENFGVASQLLREGNFDGARQYSARAESALSPGWAAADPVQAAAVRLFGAYVAWLQDNPTETVRALDAAAITAERLPDAERRELHLRIWPLYSAIGRLRQAQRTIDAIRPADGRDFANTLVADLATAALLLGSGEPSRLREFVAPRWGDSLPVSAPPFVASRIEFLIEAGLLDAAERDLEWFKRRTNLTEPYRYIHLNQSASLELARGRPHAAIAALRQAMPITRQREGRSLIGRQGQYAAFQLATALDAVGNVSEAIEILEEAVGHRAGVTMANTVTPHQWMRANAQLARMYRKNGQEAKAQAIEDQFLTLLALSDVDHPLARELRARR